MSDSRPVLAFDFGSPVTTCAVALDGRLLAALEADRQTRDAGLLPLINDSLEAAGTTPAGLGGIVATSGPGSFTGLRVACATALGLHQAIGVRATAVSSLEALALSAPPDSGPVLAVIDAMRGEWFAQPFDRGADDDLEPIAVPERRRAAELEIGPRTLLVGGVDLDRFLDELPAVTWRSLTVRRVADAVARAASLDRWPWRADLLQRPHYLRAPAVRRPA
jgi:tRNA threonylcarbamoyl adenosine modification protein YeaZ